MEYVSGENEIFQELNNETKQTENQININREIMSNYLRLIG